MRKRLILLLAIFPAVVRAATPPKPVRSPVLPVRLSGPAVAAMQKINPERIRAHVRFLSHDLLEGRGTGQRLRRWQALSADRCGETTARLISTS